MYTPPMFKSDRAESLAFAEARGFGTACTWNGKRPVASSLPFYLSYAADGTSLVASDKTVTDHLASMVSKKDCALWRVLRGRAVCKEREGDKDPYNVNYYEPQRMVGEDGVHYAPPLRPAADAPASSWDAAAYKAAPTAPPAPVTAVAQGANDAAPTVLAETTPSSPAPPAAKPKKPKKHSVKKPSRRPAAPAS